MTYIHYNISKYNYQDQLLENRKTYFDDNYNESITITTYEYFVDGQIKKIYQANGNETIIVYEATLDSNNRIVRKTSGLQSVGISYNNYFRQLLIIFTIPGNYISSEGIFL